MFYLVFLGLIEVSLSAQTISNSIRPKCRFEPCLSTEYCDWYNAECHSCIEICDRGCRSYDPEMCNTLCQEYLNNQRYVLREDLAADLSGIAGKFSVANSRVLGRGRMARQVDSAQIDYEPKCHITISCTQSSARSCLCKLPGTGQLFAGQKHYLKLTPFSDEVERLKTITITLADLHLRYLSARRLLPPGLEVPVGNFKTLGKMGQAGWLSKKWGKKATNYNRVQDDAEVGPNPKQNGLKLAMPTTSATIVAPANNVGDGAPTTTSTPALSRTYPSNDTALENAYETNSISEDVN